MDQREPRISDKNIQRIGFKDFMAKKSLVFRNNRNPDQITLKSVEEGLVMKTKDQPN